MEVILLEDLSSQFTHSLHLILSKGNGSPFQCSCLENPRDGGAWLVAVYGVTQSQTWLKQLSSNSNKGQSLWLCGSPETVENSERDGNTGPPDLALEKSVCRSGSNSRTGHGTTDWFQIGKGVCQGCILSPCLCNLYVKYIMRNARLDES